MKDQGYQLWAALLVESYREMVNHFPGLLQVPYLAEFIESLMDHWIAWKVERTMEEVDDQAAEILETWGQDDTATRVVFSEDLEGETPLGGEMRLETKFHQDE